MSKKTSKRVSKPEVVKITPTSEIKELAKLNKMTEQEYIENVLMKQGFMVYVQESENKGTTGKASLQYVNLWGTQKQAATTSDIQELRRLRKEFAPITKAVNFVKDYILGSGLDIQIKKEGKSEDYKDDLKLKLQRFIHDVYQDVYTQGLLSILDILLDEALTTGSSAAEIVYGMNLDFNKYSKPVMLEKDKKEVLSYETFEPESWSESKLEGMKRLKIIDDAVTRLKLYRKDDNSWEANFWSLDELQQPVVQIAPTASQIASGKDKGIKQEPKPLDQVIKFLPWQIFWLTVNRNNWDYKGDGIIRPVVSLAQILEKIHGSVGEGFYRAGNKKYFIICGTEKRPWGDTLIRNVLTQIQNMGSQNWAAIPVPSGFDIKDVGGEVFEGKDIIEYFVGLIAEAMHVPREVLVPTRENEHVWQSSMVGLKRLQLSVQSAIETQLFARHLWCEYGKIHTKQGGRGKEPLYIPNVKWLREDQLSLRDHVDLLFKSLNVANPIRPEVKLRVEEDFCNLMGWDDVMLPTQDELKKEMEEMAKQIKEQKDQKIQSPLVGEKEQGQPEAPTEEKQKKRLEAGVSKKIKATGQQTEKGISKPMGGTRNPAEVQESEVEESQIEPQKPQEVKITVETKHEPLRISVENEPQEIVIKSEAVHTPLNLLDQLHIQIAENERQLQIKQSQLIDKQKELADEESKKRQNKIQKEIDKLNADIEESKKRQQELEAQIKLKETETKKEEVETEEIKKTQENRREETKKTQQKKREIMDKIADEIRKEEDVVQELDDDESRKQLDRGE